MSSAETRPDGAPPRFDLGRLPASVRVGEGVRIYAHRARIGDGVVLGDRTVIVGDDVTIGPGTAIERDCDLRAGSIHVGERSQVQSGVTVLVAETFAVGRAARIASAARILCRDFNAGNLLYFGDEANVGYGGTMTSTATVRIGNHVTIGQHSILNANCPIEIGDEVGTGSYLAIWTHGYHFGHGPLDGYQPRYAAVTVGRNVWLGFQVTILPGVSIGENTMVAAGSVVTADVPADVLVGGVPAKVRKVLPRQTVVGAQADDAVAAVLDTWCRELAWKGCRVEVVRTDAGARELVVALADGSHPTRVVLVRGGDALPPSRGGEALAAIAVEPRPDGPARDDVALFVLRTGALTGPSSPVTEDLRDQLRRHGMSCGDSTCFSAIVPERFGRLHDSRLDPPARQSP